MIITDEKLVREFLEGREEALEQLIDRYLKPLFGFVFQLTGDTCVSEDIVQEVFVKTWKNLAKFDDKKKFSTWIFAIAKNTAFDWLKKKKTVPFSAFENSEGENALNFIKDESSSSVQEILNSMDLKIELNNIVSQLPEVSQSILLLHHTQGFSLAEIAEIFGKSNNTIKSQYFRSILDLRKKVFTKNPLFKA